VARLTPTQKYALAVAIVAIAVIAFLIVNGTFQFGEHDPGDDIIPQEEEFAADDDADDLQGGAPAVAGPQPMHRAFQFGDLRVIVTGLTVTDLVGQEGAESEALERFAMVHLSARNTGTSPIALDGALGLVDATGRSFSPNRLASENAGIAHPSHVDALVQVLQPGIITQLVVVFDIPHDAYGLRLRIAGGYAEVELDVGQ
jgi:hypothetical protein